MILAEEDSLELERFSTKLCGVHKNSFNGLLTASKLSENPLNAAIICLASLYKPEYDHVISEFIAKYSSDNDYTFEEYFNELKELTNNIKNNTFYFSIDSFYPEPEACK